MRDCLGELLPHTYGDVARLAVEQEAEAAAHPALLVQHKVDGEPEKERAAGGGSGDLHLSISVRATSENTVQRTTASRCLSSIANPPTAHAATSAQSNPIDGSSRPARRTTTRTPTDPPPAIVRNASPPSRAKRNRPTAAANAAAPRTTMTSARSDTPFAPGAVGPTVFTTAVHTALHELKGHRVEGREAHQTRR
jgi:hypothetical protein